VARRLLDLTVDMQKARQLLSPVSSILPILSILSMLAVAGLALFVGACSGGASSRSDSACGGCAADELCVQSYDGTCKPMSAVCVKVGADCRQIAKTQPEACMSAANESCRAEICGPRSDAGYFLFACGGPACANEVAGKDIGCYGP